MLGRKDFKYTTVLLLVILAVLLYFLLDCNNCSEKFTNTKTQEDKKEMNVMNNNLVPSQCNNNKQNKMEYMDNLDDNLANFDDVFNKPLTDGNSCGDIVKMNEENTKKYNSKDYLPQEYNDKWFDTDFNITNKIDDENLINTEKYVVGVNTVGQSLKNASYDIRGTIPNPKFSISPWNNSTIEPDYNIKPLI
jgi:hypothetical protein